MQLRLARPDDVPALATILVEESVRRWWRDTEARGLLHDGAFVAEADGEVVGFLSAEEEREPDYRFVAFDLFVATAHQGRGVGPAMLRWGIARYTEQGHHRFQIDPTVANERAVRAYRKAGFEPVGVLRASERQADGTWADALLMDLVLT